MRHFIKRCLNLLIKYDDIMEDTCTCPSCDMDNAYFDGVVYVCPDCDYEWSK